MLNPAGRLSPATTLKVAPAGMLAWVGVALAGPTPTVVWIAGYQSCGLGDGATMISGTRASTNRLVIPSVRRMVALVLCCVVGAPKMTPVAPSVSTALSCLATALRFAMRCMPRWRARQMC